jgi:hypothetical protein
MAKPHFRTEGSSPQFEIQARYDYDQTPIGSVPFSIQSGLGLWGSGIWGTSVWGSGLGTAGAWRGLSGIGSAVAIALKGSSIGRTTLIHIDVTFLTGGVL